MKKVVVVRKTFNEYQSVVMIHHNQNNETHMAHSFFYNGRDGYSHLLFLYKDALPKKPFLEAWNELDDTSIHIVIVPEVNHEQGIDDFLSCWCPEQTLETIEINEIDEFSEIEKMLAKKEMKTQEVMFFAIKR
ncbi:MAG: hypothetical protein RR766_07785 [Longicatena sp.]